MNNRYSSPYNSYGGGYNSYSSPYSSFGGMSGMGGMYGGGMGMGGMYGGGMGMGGMYGGMGMPGDPNNPQSLTQSFSQKYPGDISVD
jgi:peroxin-13